MKAIAISNPVKAIINANGITEINNKIGPPITAFHVNVEKIFNRTWAFMFIDYPKREGKSV
jgi:hypothetical protein